MREDEQNMTGADDKNVRAYPCDSDGERRRSYPCDTDFGENAQESGAADTELRTQGKGRRGGNAAASKVVRSGKAQQHPDYSKDRYQWQEERARENARTSYGFSKDGDRRGFDRREQGSFNRDGERRSFDRGERRSYGGRDERRGFDRREQGGFNRDGDRRTFDRGERRSFGRTDDRRGADRGDRRSFGRAEDRRGSGRMERGRIDVEAERALAAPKKLTVTENTEIGSFLLLEDGKRVLLPFAEQTHRPAVGEEVTVCLYADKGGRLTATMRRPILSEGELGVLKVAEVTSIGLFLDNGVPKQLLVPFREQICTPKKGQDALVYVYADKTGRQAATMRVYKHLQSHSPYQADEHVKGFVYEINPELGVFVAVDNRYFGMIPRAEVLRPFRYGEEIEARVIRVREDGKLDLSVREKAYASIAQDAEAVLYELKRNGGMLPYADKADAAFIEETYAMSKNQFKRALGHLYKEKKILIDRAADTVQLCEE